MLKKLALAALLVSPAIASAQGIYLMAGGAVGSTDMKALEDTYLPPFETDDDVERAVIGLGASINPYLALEALYMTKVENTVEDGFTRDELEHQGIQVAVIGKAPITPQFALFGRLSANSISTTYTFRDFTGPGYFQDDQTGAYLGFGAGMEFQVNDVVGIRLQMERIQLRDVTILDTTLRPSSADFDVDQASLALTYNF